MMQVLKSTVRLGNVVPNIATMLKNNAGQFSDNIVFQEKTSGKFSGISWVDFYNNIENIAYNLKLHGFGRGDKVVFYSRNRIEMLQMELAVMASGGISVPIFANFIEETADLLIRHSGAKFIATAGATQLSRLKTDLPVKHIFVFDDVTDSRFSNLSAYHTLLQAKPVKGSDLLTDAIETDICLNMYTSGTMSTPKCVQLSHQNILSQQAALKQLWNIDENDRFLSYLPWHHSFGGIFEKFCALYHGATISLESSYGRDANEIFENWRQVKPTVFFSIPKVYQELVNLTKSSTEAENLFFHSGLKFIFTAAAPLPEMLSNEFEKRQIPVIEGWGLTETSPCCTLTDPREKRETGVVGKPIPGVEIRLDGDNEIQVKGPNVMCGYYDNEEANKNIFTEDGWFRTGDIGEFTASGLKLIARKDRIFKLSNGEKVIPTDIEKLIEKKCHYISFAVVAGGGEEYPVALLFPNREMLHNPNYDLSPMEGCFCPRSLDELGKCLHGCLHDANCGIGQKFAKVKSATIVDDSLSIENNTLTPSMKVAPNNVVKAYKAQIENMYNDRKQMGEDIYVINLENKQ